LFNLPKEEILNFSNSSNFDEIVKSEKWDQLIQTKPLLAIRWADDTFVGKYKMESGNFKFNEVPEPMNNCDPLLERIYGDVTSSDVLLVAQDGRSIVAHKEVLSSNYNTLIFLEIY
jgi:hypothetical protein